MQPSEPAEPVPAFQSGTTHPGEAATPGEPGAPPDPRPPAGSAAPPPAIPEERLEWFRQLPVKRAPGHGLRVPALVPHPQGVLAMAAHPKRSRGEPGPPPEPPAKAQPRRQDPLLRGKSSLSGVTPITSSPAGGGGAPVTPPQVAVAPPGEAPTTPSEPPAGTQPVAVAGVWADTDPPTPAEPQGPGAEEEESEDDSWGKWGDSAPSGACSACREGPSYPSTAPPNGRASKGGRSRLLRAGSV